MGDTREVPAYRVDRWRGRTTRWCVVVPVINEGSRIASLLTSMRDNDVASLADVIIVDGGSTDGSLGEGLLDDARVAGVLVKTGPGKLSAQLRCAYAFALDQGFDGIVTIDGNNKDDPADIAQFVAALEAGVDFAQASRFIAGGVGVNTPRSRQAAIRLIHAPVLSVSSGFRWTDTTQGFRAYSSRVLLDPRVAPFRDVFATYELLAYLSHRVPRLKYRCVELPTSRRYPQGEVPSKIGGVRGNLGLVATLARAATGRYNPDAST